MVATTHGHLPPEPSGPTREERRLVSLDALRGFDMFWIVGGGLVARLLAKASGSDSLQWIPSQLDHVPWDGFHFIDLIFPLFLFLIGVAIPYSLGKRLERGDSLTSICRRVVFRVAVLVVLGMMVNGNLLTYDPKQFQLTYSVLQMLALGYLVASIVYLGLRVPLQIAATAAMLLGYWLLLAFVPGPGHQIGVFQEHCNLGDWLNDWVLGELQGPWRFGWILAILGHASTAMLGVFAGQLLRSKRSHVGKLTWLVGLGLACLAAGYVWSGWAAEDLQRFAAVETGWRQWPVWFPIIKNRWTSTFALYAGGWSYLLLALFYLVIDVWQLRRWAFPFVVIGSNSIFAYMAWQLASSALRQTAEVFLVGLKQYLAPAWYEPLAWAGASATLWLLLWYLYRNNTFIRP
jgi:predicted acyltransferase